jgi:phosphate transport system substrate-binding protein
MNSNRFIGAAMALSVSILACDKSAPPAPESPPSPAASAATSQAETGAVQLSGSSALQPLVNAAKEKYEAEHKGVSIEVSAGGSKKGLTDVASGAVHIGNSDIFAPGDLQGQLVDHRVAVVGFAAMANKGAFDEKVTAIGLADMAKIFSGAITNWKQLGGGSQPIVVINRSPNSGTRAVFGSIVLGGDKFVEAQTEDNSGALVAKLKQTSGAISYLALSFADPDLQVMGLKSEAGATIEPSAANIATGSYPIWSYEHMYTKGQPGTAAKSFLDYMLSTGFQDQVLPTVKGFIPVTQMKISRDKD